MRDEALAFARRFENARVVDPPELEADFVDQLAAASRRDCRPRRAPQARRVIAQADGRAALRCPPPPHASSPSTGGRSASASAVIPAAAGSVTGGANQAPPPA